MEHQNIEIVNENSKVRNEAKTNMKAMMFYKKTRKKKTCCLLRAFKYLFGMHTYFSTLRRVCNYVKLEKHVKEDP